MVLTGLGAVLERSWVILGHLGRAWGHLVAIWGRLGESKTLIFVGFSMILAKSHFRTKIVILAGLGAFLGPLGAILSPLSPAPASEDPATGLAQPPFSHRFA